MYTVTNFHNTATSMNKKAMPVKKQQQQQINAKFHKQIMEHHTYYI